MCKLYAIQGEFTKDEAAAKIKEKVKIIRRTEDDGLGIVVHCQGNTLTWQCGESIFDYIGSNVLDHLDDTPRMTTIAVHGRTSTSKNNDVVHSHPRKTTLGPLMHNGVVFPKHTNPFIGANGEREEWKEEYDLDTDYLAELADRGLLDIADEYLEGYAGVILVQNDGTLVVQNQGANLYMTLKPAEIEFGTTTELCHFGNKFDSMRAECKDGTLWVRPIQDLEKKQYKDRFQDKTDKKDSEEKKVVGQLHTGTDTNTNQQQASIAKMMEQKKKNKKGRKFNLLSKRTLLEDKQGTSILINGKLVKLEDWLKHNAELSTKDQKELLESIRG